MINRKKLRIPAIISSPLEPLLQLKRTRLITIGALFALGHPLLWALWDVLEPSSDHHGAMHLVLAAGALPFLFISVDQARHSPLWQRYCVLYILAAGPLFLTFMYLMSPESAIWTTVMCLSAVFTFQALDWRLASVGMVTSLGGVLFSEHLPLVTAPSVESIIAIALSWFGGILIGVSTAKEQIRRIHSTLSALGVMAHELRTPLATAALIAEGLSAGADSKRSAERLNATIRSMNHHIDSQIVNAQLLEMRAGSDLIGARELIQNAIDTYPMKREKSRADIVAITKSNFLFMGTPRLFNQVIQNLIKNALQSVVTARGTMSRGDIQIEIEAQGQMGFIRIKDKGSGIKEGFRQSIFEPFYSTQNTYSSGLGLPFCKQVVEVNGGRIWVEENSPGEGATFTIKMPCDHHFVGIVASRPADLPATHADGGR